MLYSIIPPILVVLSLVALIIFLMKKSSRVAELDLGEASKKGEDVSGKFEARGIAEKEQKTKFGTKVLLILEKIMRWLKVVFLKMDNKLSSWSESVRQKRRINKERKIEFPRMEKMEKLEKKDEEVFFERRMPRNMSEIRTEIEVPKRDEVEQKTNEKKDLFEKILIERIAANPKDIEAYERLGEYYMEIESWNYAKECYKQVIKLNPGNSAVKMKMKKLERLLGK